MAGPWVMSAVPRRTQHWRTPGCSTGRATPMSTGITSAPARAAMRHTLVLPVAMLSVTTAVTSCPV